MKRELAVVGVLLSMYGISADAYDANAWPTHYKFSDGTDVGISGTYEWDDNSFSSLNGLTPAQQSPALDDAHATRREEINVFIRKVGVYDAGWGWDYWNKAYQNVFVRLETKAFLGEDYGKVRFGYSKTYVGFESVTQSCNLSFLETALPEQAFFEGRRTGVDWEFERPEFRFDIGAYGGQDLQGDNDGTTLGGRFAWTPFNTVGNVLHLGVVGSEENPDSSVVNGRGQTVFPSARLRARPDVLLTTTRFVDTNTIKNVDHIDRTGLEGLWIRGPWSVQGEYLNEDVHRTDGKPSVSGSGGYIFGSWVVTGESRPYSKGNVGNLKPDGRWGALELLARYDEIDLNDIGAGVHGGKQHNWTIGANWYLLQHFRLQANYILVHESGNPAFNKGGSLDPKIFGLRAMVYF